MHIAYTSAQVALRQELRDYFAELMTPEVLEEVARGETGGPHCLEAVRKMGRDGWLGLGWPEEFGGRGASPWEQTVVREEMWAHHEPRGAQYMGVNWVGPAIMRHGTGELDERPQRDMGPLYGPRHIYGFFGLSQQLPRDIPVADLHQARGLDPFAIDVHESAGHGVGRERTALEEARAPQPLVDT